MRPSTHQAQKKFQLDSERKDMRKSTMFKENIIIDTLIAPFKMPAFKR